MNKKGFTLVELLAVIVIILLLITIIAPKVFNQLNSAGNVTQTEQIKSLINVAKIYVQKNNIDIDNNDYEIITIENIKNSGLINKNTVLDPKTKEELTGCIKVTNGNNKYIYEYKEANECE